MEQNITIYQQIFDKYHNVPIALYGLSTETERVLIEDFSEYNVVGLLDGFHDDGYIYGKPIITLSCCLEKQVKLIIVVARPGSCRAIAKKIGRLCEENQIELIDIRGKNLCVQKSVVYDFEGIEGYTKAQLWEAAIAADVISFDLFDTLIMRQVLSSIDVISLTETRLHEQNIYIEDFTSIRQQAEKELSRNNAPDLIHIYQYLIDKSNIKDISPDKLAEIEWSVEQKIILPRKEMVDFLNQMHALGKEIYIVTDTYYHKNQIEKLLEQCGIRDYSGLFVSCEYHKGKTQGLFDELTQITVEKKVLHIGDDDEADINGARNCGVEGFKIFSSIDLLEVLNYLGTWELIETLSSRIKLGMFIANVFNSPFWFEDCNRTVTIKNEYDIGYLFAAPMITDFTLWLFHSIADYDIANVWLGARDGYLVKALYDMIQKDISSIYFYTSRTAAIRAGVETPEDIKYVSSMKFSGDVSRQLKERFGISADQQENQMNVSILDYSEKIFDCAKTNRSNYLKYINSLSMNSGDIAFFDFVAKGTTQMFISRLTNNHIKGFYFLQLEKEFMKDKKLDIISFYDNETANSAIYENYYILETILTSPEASVCGFDIYGRPVFSQETRTKENIQCFEEIQRGIKDYFSVYLSILGSGIETYDKELDERLLSLIHKIDIDCKRFMKMEVEDPFFNRRTNVSDLIS